MMVKAKTLSEVYNNFEGNKPLSVDEYDFFVNIYEKKLKRFVGNVQRNTNYQNIFFIAGQRGNGKSTILNNLKHRNNSFETKYEIRHLQAMELLDYDDIDIVDILLIIGFNLIDDNGLNSENKKILTDEFKEKLTKLEAVNNGELEITEQVVDSDAGEHKFKAHLDAKVKFFSFFSVGSELSATYKSDKNIRKEAKRIYKFKTKDLLTIINGLFLEYQRLSENSKDILLILDGLEKLKNIDDVFTKDINLLRDIKCYKIITMPVYLKETVDVYDVKAIDFTMEVDSKGNIKNKELLRTVIENRIDTSVDLITSEAIDIAIKMSGGNLRQLLNIVQTASSEAMDIFETDKIGIDEVKSAIEVLKGHLASRTQFYSSFLKLISDSHKVESIEEQDELSKTLQSGLVFAYFNGRVYYDVNPIIKDNLV